MEPDLPIDPPPGFDDFGHDHIGFVTMIGPLFIRRDDGVDTIGWRVRRAHCNAFPMAHGGMTAAFADILTSYAVFTARQPRGDVLTLSLTTDFISAAPLGAWVHGSGKVVMMGTSIAFSTCEIYADGKLIAHASGKFKIRPKTRAA